MLVFEQILGKEKDAYFSLQDLLTDEKTRENILILSLKAEDRSRTRYRFQSDDGQDLCLRLARGTVLDDGDLLQANTGEYLIIKARAEDVLTITSPDYLQLIKAAYHLGNRHTPCEITPIYLRIGFDPILAKMLAELGLEITQETVAFYPQKGAYQHP